MKAVYQRCRCPVCLEFDMEPWGYGATGECDVCRRLDKSIMSRAPSRLTPLTGIGSICWSCRNILNLHVLAKWGLCWRVSETEALKWAIADFWLWWYDCQWYCHVFKADIPLPKLVVERGTVGIER